MRAGRFRVASGLRSEIFGSLPGVAGFLLVFGWETYGFVVVGRLMSFRSFRRSRVRRFSTLDRILLERICSLKRVSWCMRTSALNADSSTLSHSRKSNTRLALPSRLELMSLSYARWCTFSSRGNPRPNQRSCLGLDPMASQSSTHRFLHEHGDPCLFGGSQPLQREGGWPHVALVEFCLVTESQRRISNLELRSILEEADDFAVLAR